jgi:hypothetical protein
VDVILPNHKCAISRKWVDGGLTHCCKADLNRGKHETFKFGLRPFTSPTQNLRAFH